jgi:hypothetical protein
MGQNSAMKKLALISGLLFVIVVVWVTFFRSEEKTVEGNFTLTTSGSLSSDVDAGTTITPASFEGDANDNITPAYYLIVGSYSDIIQARQAAVDFRNDYDGDFIILPVTPRGYYRISYGRYSTPEAADATLSTVRQTINADAWVYSTGD